MKKMPSLGDLEMELLKYVSEQAPISVRDVASYFELEKNLARTTVLTVMERLRKKGFLVRQSVQGIYQYSPKVETADLIKSKITEFVNKTLGGSVSPLLTYFVASENLSDDEVQKLKSLVAKLEAKK